MLKEIGFKNVRVYGSSWLGYGNTLDAPAESVTFFNVGLMRSKVNAMRKAGRPTGERVGGDQGREIVGKRP